MVLHLMRQKNIEMVDIDNSIFFHHNQLIQFELFKVFQSRNGGYKLTNYLAK